MFQIQVLARLQRDEELTLVRVLPIVGHADDSRSLVCQPRIKLVSEGFPTCECALTSFTSPCRITPLKHEVVNQAVENSVVVVSTFTKPDEIVRGSGHKIAVELDIQHPCTRYQSHVALPLRLSHSTIDLLQLFFLSHLPQLVLRLQRPSRRRERRCGLARSVPLVQLGMWAVFRRRNLLILLAALGLLQSQTFLLLEDAQHC
mmetsp:Transcript_37512/g.99711  ORF Transcript_37512/g.99711 Transcript_37512/m.99711 type:complete len:203 (-) Transcript_37512:247-855(-)